MSKIVAVDIDDTCYSFTNLAREQLDREAVRTGDEKLRQAAYAPWPEWRSPPDLLSVETWLEIIDQCHTDESILAQEPYPGAAEVVWDLWRAGYKIKYVSNRRPTADLATGAWLLEKGFPVAADGGVELHCTTANKRELLSDCQYLIDDRPQTLVGFVSDFVWKNTYGSTSRKHERLAFGLQKEFNRNLTDVKNIYLAPSWRGIRYYLGKKGLLDATSDSGANNSRASRIPGVAESVR